MIECDEIDQEIERLKIAFQDCKPVKNSDLLALVELITAARSCSMGGTNYNVRVTEVLEPTVDTVITYPVGTYHSITLAVGIGEVLYQGFSFPAGSSTSEEVTTLNQTAYTFTVKAGSKVLVEYLIES